jgi:thiol-disulfide isomerase/thioredoxin
LKLRDAEGRVVDLADFRGKLVFLNFWATWCVPCRREMPAMERLHRAYRGRGLTVVAVNFKESPREVKPFMEQMGLTFPAALDPDGAVTRSFGVRALPVTYLVDRDGKILWKAQGRREWDSPQGRAYFERVLAAHTR